MKNELQKLFSLLVCYRHNIHMLHWKVSGHSFMCLHKVLDYYVDKFNSFIDDIAELMLSTGINPLTLQECLELISNNDEHHLLIESTENYDANKVYDALLYMISDLFTVYNKVSEECIYSECNSKLDEHKYWLRIEWKYKIERVMK